MSFLLSLFLFSSLLSLLLLDDDFVLFSDESLLVSGEGWCSGFDLLLANALSKESSKSSSCCRRLLRPMVSWIRYMLFSISYFVSFKASRCSELVGAEGCIVYAILFYSIDTTALSFRVSKSKK